MSTCASLLPQQSNRGRIDAVLYHTGALAVAGDDDHELRSARTGAGVRAQLVAHAPQARHTVGRLVIAPPFCERTCCIRIFPNFKFGFSLLLDSDFPERSAQPRAPDLPREPATFIKQPVQRTILAVPFRMLARRQAIHDGIPRRENSRGYELIQQFYLRRCTPAPGTQQSRTARAHPITRPPARHEPDRARELQVEKTNGMAAAVPEKRCISQPVARKTGAKRRKALAPIALSAPLVHCAPAMRRTPGQAPCGRQVRGAPVRRHACARKAPTPAREHVATRAASPSRTQSQP